MFVRSVLEYGNVIYMGASDTNLAKLDRVQTSAERIGGFTIESLTSKRKASAVCFGWKGLRRAATTLVELLRLFEKRTCYVASAGLSLNNKARTNSLYGSIPTKLPWQHPQDLVKNTTNTHF